MKVAAEPLPMVQRADDVPGPAQGCWTYADYAALPDDGWRYEIIRGVLYRMPSPTTIHQRAVKRFVRLLGPFVEDTGLGEVFVAPLDVELARDDTVQPDVFVILKGNPARVTDSHVFGAPDLVIEVKSPGTAGYDRREKQDSYARAGVREYWVADGGEQTIELLRLTNGVYVPVGVFQGASTLPSVVLPGLPVTVEQFFE